jgi:hypothetical protein
MLSMNLWNIPGAVFGPKGIVLYWNKPLCVMNAVFHLWSGCIGIW